MKYTPQYFKENLPATKNSKSSFLVRNFYRKISFYFSSLAYMIGFTANRVSFLGTLIAFLAAGLYLSPIKWVQVLGGVMTAVWLVSDCVDGNLARCVGKQPYGEFIDAVGSYTIVALILPTVGFAAYNGNSVILNYNPWVVLLGGLGGIADTLARLYYQKYLNERKVIEGLEESKNNFGNEGKMAKLNSIYMRLSKEIGISGLMIPFLIIATIFNWLDIFVVFYFLFYGVNYLAAFAILLKNTGCLKKV
jgi:hypothetical protein